MVVFTCNSCGDSLKKNKVDNHRYQCRMGSLSCVDCLKDFSLQTYSAHNECITEDQKYGGLDYKQQEFKGKAKQNDWMQKIKDVINSKQHAGHMENLLQRLLNYDNIPRKKAKFVNFVKNSFGLRNEKIVNDIWDIFEKATKTSGQAQNGVNNKTQHENDQQKNGVKRPLNVENQLPVTTCQNNTKKIKSENEQSQTIKHTNGDEVQLKMKNVIKKYLQESSNQQLGLTKLRKKVLRLYAENGYDNENDVMNSFDKIIKKRFVFDEQSSIVMLKS